MNAAPSITDTIQTMISQSIQVLSKPSVATFEQYENHGKVREAVIYMALAALITGVLGLGGGLGGLVSGLLVTILGFLAFSYLIFFIGKSQGGSGTFDQVAYSFSLFYAPLSVLFGVVGLILLITVVGILLIPFLGIAAIAANVYFSYLAVQASMNLTESGKIWITLIGGAVASLVVTMVIASIFS